MKPETIPSKPVDFDAIQLQRIRNYNESRIEDETVKADLIVAKMALALFAFAVFAVSTAIIVKLILG